MFIRDSEVVCSASDITAASQCEWSLMRRLDAKLGRIDRLAEVDDPMLKRAGMLGGVHELAALGGFVHEFGEHRSGEFGGVAVLASVSAADPVAMAAACAATIAALQSGADVVYQAAFSTEQFAGFADFLVRTPDGSYEVYDTKLARKAKITALLQLAAYACELQRIGIPVGAHVHLLLGDGTTSSHRLDDIAPVFAERWDRLRWMVDQRLTNNGPIAWDAAGYLACGRCAECAEQVEATRDVLLVAGMRLTQRTRLAQDGIHTIDELAASAGKVDGIGEQHVQPTRPRLSTFDVLDVEFPELKDFDVAHDQLLEPFLIEL